MSNFNPDQIFRDRVKLYFNTENPNLSFFLKFSILTDIIITKRNFISKSNIAVILQNELVKKTKKISLEYELVEQEAQEKKDSPLIGVLRIDILDNLIGSFAGKLNVNANFKSFKNASNQNYFLPLNCNSQELKNLRFENLNETYVPLDNFLNENLISKIFVMNNLNKLTINFNNSNANKINTNLQTNVFNNPQVQNEKKYISDYDNFNFNNKNTNAFSMDNNFNNPMNPNFVGGNTNIHLTSEEIPVEKKIDLGIDENEFYARNQEEFDPEQNYNKNQANKETSEDIYNREINMSNINNPQQIGGNPKLQVPFDKRVPKQDYWDPNDPQYEVFNPNYQINPNRYINPNLSEGNFIMPGGNNPFFSSEGGMVPGGELVGPGSDIFSKEHPHHMQKKPGAKIRYDPIGPFGTFGGPDKGNKHDDPFQG